MQLRFAALAGAGLLLLLLACSTGWVAPALAQRGAAIDTLITVTPGTSRAADGVQLPGPVGVLSQADAAAITAPGQAPDIVAVSPELNLPFGAVITYQTRRAGTRVNGVTLAFEGVHGVHAALGAWFTQADEDSHTPVVMLGANVAQGLFGSSDPTGQEIQLQVGRPLPLQVAGVLSSTRGGPLPGVDDDVFLPLTTLQHQFSNPRNPDGLTNLSQIVAEAVDAARVPAAKAEIIAVLLAQHNVQQPNFTLTSLPPGCGDVPQTLLSDAGLAELGLNFLDLDGYTQSDGSPYLAFLPAASDALFCAQHGDAWARADTANTPGVLLLQGLYTLPSADAANSLVNLLASGETSPPSPYFQFSPLGTQGIGDDDSLLRFDATLPDRPALSVAEEVFSRGPVLVVVSASSADADAATQQALAAAQIIDGRLVTAEAR